MPDNTAGQISVSGYVCPECGVFVSNTDVHPTELHMRPVVMGNDILYQSVAPSEEIQLLKEIRDLLQQLVNHFVPDI